MRIVLAVAVLGLSATALAGTRGNGQMVTEVRNVRGFTAVEIQVSIDADIQEGREFKVKLKVDQNLAPLIRTEVRGDTLVVRCDENIDPNRDARVEIVLPDLRAVAAAGSGDVSVKASRRKDISLAAIGSGDLRYHGPAAHLKVGASGSGDVDVQLTGDADDVEVGAKGSGDVTLQGGHANELVAAVAGSGSVNAQDLTAHDGKLAATGSGDIQATLEGGSASFALAGSGDITWRGSASVERQVRAGSGEIIHH